MALFRKRVSLVFLLALIALTLFVYQMFSSSIAYIPGMQPYNPKLTEVPPPGQVKKAIVLAKTRLEDISWLEELMPSWTPYIYSASYPPEKGYSLVTNAARGREATTYLKFIIDFYDDLPLMTAFVHASNKQWHNADIGVETSRYLKNLRTKTVLEKGYVNLRCSHEEGCPVSVSPFEPSEIDIRNNDIRANFVEVYMDLLGLQSEKDVPRKIGAACCAQFAVSRDQIRRKPLSYYVNMQEWILHRSSKYVDSFGSGWVFEKIWHLVFDQPATDCPDERQCRCDLYGWCGPFADVEEKALFRKMSIEQLEKRANKDED